MKNYNVHLYITLRVKVPNLEANSQLEAIEEAEKKICPLLNNGVLDLTFYPCNTEYADEITGYLVDEVGDEEYLQSEWYDGNKESHPGPMNHP